MARVEGAEQPLADSVSEGVSEAGSEVDDSGPSEGAESWQWAELKWSRRADESGAVKSQRRQRQHAWTRLQRGEETIKLNENEYDVESGQMFTFTLKLNR